MTVKQSGCGIEIFLSSKDSYIKPMAHPTKAAQSRALEQFYRRSDWIGVARCARNLLKLEACGSRN